MPKISAVLDRPPQRRTYARPSQLPSLGSQPVAVDVETSGLHVDDGARLSVVSLAWFDPEHDGDPDHLRACAFPFDQGATSGKMAATQGDLFNAPDETNLPEQEWRVLLHWLQHAHQIGDCPLCSHHGADALGPLQRLVFQNANFDLHHIRTGTRHWTGIDLEAAVLWDTMVAAKEMDPLLPTGLEAIAQRLLGASTKTTTKTPLKDWLRRHKYPVHRYDLVPWDIMEPYATGDAVDTIRVAYAQWDRLDCGEGSRTLIRRKERVRTVLYRMEKRGLGYNSARSLDIAGQLREAQAEIAHRLPFEPSVNAAKRYFYGDPKDGGLGLIPEAVTEKKQEPKLDDEIVKRLVTAGVPNAADYQEWMKIETACTRWYEGYPAMIGPDGRLRCSFRQTKVVSERFSVERVQLQAIPHDYQLGVGALKNVPPVRALIEPAPGKELWELDLGQAELRVATRFAGSKEMLALIESGADMHGTVARDLFRVKESDPDFFEMRQVAKRGNFSLIFDVGPDTFRSTVRKFTGIDLSRNDAEEFIKRWRRKFPEFKRAVYRDMQRAEVTRCVTLINGQQSWFGPMDDTHKAFNRRVQGSIAVLGMDWMVAVEDEFPGVLCMVIHDSQVLETPIGAGDRVTRRVQQIGEEMGTKMFGITMVVDRKPWGAK